MYSLTKRALYRNDLRDLTPLASLSQLSDLDLLYNPVESLEPLAKLTSLISLRIGHPDCTLDLSPLAQCPNLQQVVCPGGEITNILALRELPQLRQLITAGTADADELAELARACPDLHIS